MILTGPMIESEIRAQRITIEPFCVEAVNPNSYNYRLGPVIKEYVEARHAFRTVQITDGGFELRRGCMYLGHTVEIIGSTTYAMSLIGRSSMGRLGLFLQVSADLGHTTSCHRWTLEMVAARTIRVYPHMVIGQVSFWCNAGAIKPIPTRYAQFDDPHESMIGAED